MKIKKDILFYFFIIILFLPLIEMNLNLFEIKQLNGSFKLTQRPDTLSGMWFSKEYQKQYDIYFNDHLGFRNLLIRFNNQIKFSLFSKTSAKKVVIGKNGYLFEKDYISEYYGNDYIGDKKLRIQSKNLKEIQDFFKKKNVDIIPVFVTGKGSFYNEYIPDNYKRKINKTNHSELIKYFDIDSVNYINLREYFLQIKDSIKYNLYPKTGIHWSKIGAVIGIDKIIKTIETKRNINIQDFTFNDFEFPDTIRDTDNDIELGMNLLLPLEFNKMAYPIIKFDTSSTFEKINILIIGDSYSFNILRTNILQTVCDKFEMWYYNKTIEPPIKDNFKVIDYNYIEELLKYDVVLIMASESNYRKFDLGFIESYKREIMFSHYDSTILQQINSIQNNHDWFDKIKKSAKERNISNDSMLIREAVWYINNIKSKN